MSDENELPIHQWAGKDRIYQISEMTDSHLTNAQTRLARQGDMHKGIDSECVKRNLPMMRLSDAVIFDRSAFGRDPRDDDF